VIGTGGGLGPDRAPGRRAAGSALAGRRARPWPGAGRRARPGAGRRAAGWALAGRRARAGAGLNGTEVVDEDARCWRGRRGGC